MLSSNVDKFCSNIEAKWEEQRKNLNIEWKLGQKKAAVNTFH